MMIRAQIAASLLLVLSLLYIPSAVLGHVYYGAEIPEVGKFQIYTHGDEAYWQLNSSATAAGLTTLEIVDGKGSSAVEGVMLYQGGPITGVKALNGSFGAEAVAPAVAGSVDELMGHVCMGHIYVRAKTAAGTKDTAILYAPAEGSTENCEEATMAGAVGVSMHSSGSSNESHSDCHQAVTASTPLPFTTNSIAVPSPAPASAGVNMPFSMLVLIAAALLSVLFC